MPYLQKNVFSMLVNGGLIDIMCYIHSDDLNPFIRLWQHLTGTSYYLDNKGLSDRYCEKFDNIVRDECRAKYGYRCFLCGISQNDNGRRLNVHHADLNKAQGCGDVEWNIVPLCNKCHGKSHTTIWVYRIIYLIKHPSTT